MSAPIDPVKVQEAMRALGVLPSDMDALQRMPFDAARVRLEELKERTRKNFKRLALELHPDRTGSDPEKTIRFKLYGTVKDEFEKLQIQPRPQPQMVMRPPIPRPQPQQYIRVTRVVTWSSAGSAYTNSAAATQVATVLINGVPMRVATLKPE